MFENVLLVWIDPTIDVNSEIFDALRPVLNDIHPFTDHVGYVRLQIGVFCETIRPQTEPANLVDGAK